MLLHSSSFSFCDTCGLANDTDAAYCAACQHPLELVSEELLSGAQVVALQPGTVLAGHYQIGEEIGRGGFSLVYAAVDLENQSHPVAVKRIPLAALSQRQVIEATETFNREVTLLSLLKGEPGIPLFYESLTDAENWYLIMQYIPGQTLEAYVQDQPGGYLPEEATISLGIKLACILQQLHQRPRPIIFRDVKPTNIMVTPRQELYLIDFGVARFFTPGQARDTTPLGSPGYAAPEQYGRSQTDQRSDIYSLGVLLQTLFTGRDPLELADKEASRNPEATSPAFRQILDALLSSAATQRPADMEQVQKLLGGVPPAGKEIRIMSYSTPQGFVLGMLIGAIFALLSFLDQSTWQNVPVIGLLLLLVIVLIVCANRFRQRLMMQSPARRRRLPPGLLGGMLVASLSIWLLQVLWSSWFH